MLREALMTHVFKHPKYYTELRKRNKSDQAISHANSTRGPSDVRPDPGLKQCDSQVVNQVKLSSQSQASSAKLTKQQAASVKPRGTSIKLQAASVKLHDS